MKTTTRWIVGIAILVTALFVLPFFWNFPMSLGGYGMMMRGYGYHMPMMGGFGNMLFLFNGLFWWLIPIGILVLIGLGIAWLIKALVNKPS